MTTMTLSALEPQPHPEPGTDTQPLVFGGVDTHLDTHTAAVVSPVGATLGVAQFEADAAGYAALLEWMLTFGVLVLVGVEGTGSYGHGVTCYLTGQGHAVAEVDRPVRRARRGRGKSDAIDALVAARAAASGELNAVPKARDQAVEALRIIHIGRAGAVAERAKVLVQMKSLIVTAPEGLRARLRDRTTAGLIQECARLRPDPQRLADPEQAMKHTLRDLARRYGEHTVRIREYDKITLDLVTSINTQLLEINGVGPEVAAQMLITAGANPSRMRSEAAFAMLCGAAPIPASSGKNNRHRLNRGGDRGANRALHMAITSRLRWDPRAKAYFDRRTSEGKTPAEIRRCLKRYLAREIFKALRPRQKRTLDNP